MAEEVLLWVQSFFPDKHHNFWIMSLSPGIGVATYMATAQLFHPDYARVTHMKLF